VAADSLLAAGPRRPAVGLLANVTYDDDRNDAPLGACSTWPFIRHNCCMIRLKSMI